MWSEAENAASKRTLVVAGTLRRRQRMVLTVVPLAAVQPNPEQPRRYFAQEKLAELAASILERGLLQPIVVRRHEGGYQLLAGERRFRAAQIAGIDRLPAVVREGSDALEVALIENLQREDLAPLEEAEGLAALVERHAYSHREVANLLGKSRPYVSNTLTLNRLPDSVKADLRHQGSSFSREVLMGVARQPDSEAAIALWNRLKLDVMSVRRFRAELVGSGRARDPIRDTVLAARRLNRRLKRMATLEPSVTDAGSLRRVLTRTRRLIDGVVQAIESSRHALDQPAG